ncbi:hypothetical protein [Actinomadura rubrobrunea]|uniref:hypothetical protein n=1 Tax=Actinomadura rubrobrunea TaxID=115335 RepID=UPI0011B26112|nr:hypothetical protein [Actinomadura rubrobrunea]
MTRPLFGRGAVPPAGPPGDGAERPEDVLGQAGVLLRACGQDAAVAAIVLILVLVGAATQLAHGGGRLGALQLALLAPVAAASAGSAALAVRSRLVLVAALGTARGRTGAPLDPGVPWTPFASGSALDRRARDEELRRLLAAAYRCCDLAWRAVVWAAAAAVLFVCWTLAVAATTAGG